jgi:hypothetical protein
VIPVVIFALSIFYLAGLKPDKITIIGYDISKHITHYISIEVIMGIINTVRYVIAFYMYIIVLRWLYVLLAQPNNLAFTLSLCAVFVMALVAHWSLWIRMPGPMQFF